MIYDAFIHSDSEVSEVDLELGLVGGAVGGTVIIGGVVVWQLLQDHVRVQHVGVHLTSTHDKSVLPGFDFVRSS